MIHVEDRIHKALEAQRKKRDEEYRAERSAKPPTLSLSGIGECPRRLWAGLHGIEAVQPGGARLAVFAMGEAVERLALELLGRADFQVGRRQERVTIDFGDGFIASGRWDGVIELGPSAFLPQPTILEIKSANREQFEKCEALGYDVWRPAYGDTLHCYMGASKIEIAVALVFCKDNSRIYAEKIRFDAERYERLRKKAEMVLRAPRPLPRPEQANGQYSEFCKWCPVSEWCYSSTADVKFDD
jgi:hypothetical protein